MIIRNCVMFDFIQEKGCKHNQARQSRRLTAMPRVLLIYLKRMAWAVNKGSGEQEGKNIKVKQFSAHHQRMSCINLTNLSCCR